MPNTVGRICGVIGVCVTLGCTTPPPSPIDETVEVIAGSYERMQLVTPQPVFVDITAATYCMARTPPDDYLDAQLKKFGPHAHSSVRIFMNDAATTAFREHKNVYASGSVVVKEKQRYGYRDSETSSRVERPDGVGGMIKREPGYDPDHGDWEYFYVDGAGEISSGRLENCIACHTKAKETDHVYGWWSLMSDAPVEQ